MLGDKMLIKFSVKNYRNFKDEIVLDFSKTHDYKFNQECIKDDLLNKIIIFGHNGAGKSNFGYALFDIVATLTDKRVDEMLEFNYINADSKEEYAEFKYTFKFGKDVLEYNYKKEKVKKIIYEELYINDEKIYEYDFIKQKINSDNKLEIINAHTLNFEFNQPDMSTLRYIANNTVQGENSIIKSLMNFVTRMLWFRSLKDNNFIGYEKNVVDVTEWIVKNKLVKEFQEFLKQKANIDVQLAHLNITNENILVEKHKNNMLLWDAVASSGSLALRLYFYWYKHFEDISFLFIDEFDAFYHFELSRKIIEEVNSFSNMQTILTSHNTYLSNNNLMRPDCCYILDKGKLVSFADSTDRELREGHNIEKMLRQGEFDE